MLWIAGGNSYRCVTRTKWPPGVTGAVHLPQLQSPPPNRAAAPATLTAARSDRVGRVQFNYGRVHVTGMRTLPPCTG
jgi:hypothetical protein